MVRHTLNILLVALLSAALLVSGAAFGQGKSDENKENKSKSEGKANPTATEQACDDVSPDSHAFKVLGCEIDDGPEVPI